MNRWLLVLLVPFGLVLLLGLSNWLGWNKPADHKTTDLVAQAIARAKMDDNLTLAAVLPIFQAKCMDCHAPGLTRWPIYTQLPIAKDLIETDISQASGGWDLEPLLRPNPRMSNADLALLEGVLLDDSMPPLKYHLMHWDAGLMQEDKEIIAHWIEETRAKNYRLSGVSAQFRNEPLEPLPVDLKVDKAKAILGARLYNDKRLSGDLTLSCASCHSLQKGGTDRSAVATGIRGQKGPINSPTVFNAVFNARQFWNGRAATLDEQAKGPVTNPIEMGAAWPAVIKRLQSDPAYVRAFRASYGTEGITSDTIADAIATFEHTLVTPNSRFDRYLRGDLQALNAQEKHGYELFKTVGCVECHRGSAVGGTQFRKFGVKADYFSDRVRLTNAQLAAADEGRMGFSHRTADRYVFKVPTLRNIALTGPYFHDAAASDLDKAVQTMARYQLGHELSKKETQDIVAFLKTLTGEYKGQPL